MAAYKEEQRAAEAQALEGLKRRIEQALQANPDLKAMRDQVKLDMTSEGLRIQIVDEHNRPMFASGSAVVQPYMRDLLRQLGKVLAAVPQPLTLAGHTDAQPFAGGQGGYSNWELSADRANASRRELTAGGLPFERVLRVQGLAASMPFEPKEPLSPVNRRISIIVMNRDAEDRMFRSAPISGPDKSGDGSEGAQEAREVLGVLPPPLPGIGASTLSRTTPANGGSTSPPAAR